MLLLNLAYDILDKSEILLGNSFLSKSLSNSHMRQALEVSVLRQSSSELLSDDVVLQRNLALFHSLAYVRQVLIQIDDDIFPLLT